jgi:hypothetical protein
MFAGAESASLRGYFRFTTFGLHMMNVYVDIYRSNVSYLSHVLKLRLVRVCSRM